MIPRAFITGWRSQAPWSQDAWVEQDLIISRALVEIYQDPEVAQRLAFRGGTAIYKLYLKPAARYSEDLDLVQVAPEPIGDTLDRIREKLDPWLGAPRRQLKGGRVNLLYRFESSDLPPIPLRLKIEINSAEHFSEMGLVSRPFSVQNRWFDGDAEVTTFDLNELFGTKLRALFQRKKGRDLFDLWLALEGGTIQPTRVLACFERYLAESGLRVSRAQFEENLHQKGNDQAFRTDIEPLIRPNLEPQWDFDLGMRAVLKQLVSKLPGDPWKGI